MQGRQLIALFALGAWFSVSNASPQASLVELGRRLFLDPALSSSGELSCASCHDPNRYFIDGRATAVGVAGRVGRRNTPTLLNLAEDNPLLWEGRATSLEEQARLPLLNSNELDMPDERTVVSVVRNNPLHVALLREATGRADILPTFDDITRALAAYERTLVRHDSAFDRYRRGEESALSARARQGFALFTGRAQCAQCHHVTATEASFTDNDYHVGANGLPRAVTQRLSDLIPTVLALRADRSALEVKIGTDADVAALGRFLVTGRPEDIGKFKTPSLRNVVETAPYMHDGSITTLEEAIELELYGHGDTRRPIVLTQSERDELLAFLASLTSTR